MAGESTSSRNRKTIAASLRLCLGGKFCLNKFCATLTASMIARSELMGKKRTQDPSVPLAGGGRRPAAKQNDGPRLGTTRWAAGRDQRTNAAPDAWFGARKTKKAPGTGTGAFQGVSRDEWEKKYSLPAPVETKCDRTPSDESLVLSNE